MDKPPLRWVERRMTSAESRDWAYGSGELPHGAFNRGSEYYVLTLQYLDGDTYRDVPMEKHDG